MTKQELCQEMGNISDKFIEEAAWDSDEQYQKQRFLNHRGRWKKPAAAVAALAFVISAAVLIPRLQENNSTELHLLLSQGSISAKYISKLPQQHEMTSYSLDYYYSEEDAFADWDTTIFQGKIKSIRNLEINMNGSTEYRSVAEIEILKVYRGGCAAGSTVTVLVPCPIDMEGYWIEDTEVASSMRKGMTGIFMPVKCDETYYTKEGETVFYWQDVAEYGFLNGMNTMFLETDEGIVFDRYTYESIAAAKSLAEIEHYVTDMIEACN